jgi:hypothetical protein
MGAKETEQVHKEYLRRDPISTEKMRILEVVISEFNLHVGKQMNGQSIINSFAEDEFC